VDKNGDGKVSKEEFMKFMEAEFDRLDKDKDGDLDSDELKQLRVITIDKPEERSR
jgi:Ca2+-binding EF-hand superfamily protein